ncbi:putative receptor-type tyrosine-protein phosphatase F [Apostichopus japonicus]|uniref:Putative receptor-type tyrosine-protein phosphatase F n=1 Tax=Stichopus japonicus TaxID=307972 RepID=A0A2G8JVA6_STIJA|nr:putative receptor-type tyrosine-protein phosphatase F [Apostichopus japonicus]
MRGLMFILSDLVVGRLSADTTNFHPLHIILTWASSPSVYCEALYYEVAYSLLQQDGCRTIPPREQEITVAGNSTGTQFKIKHLHLFSTYKFFVRAVTETGEGNYSEMRYETPEGEPPSPTNVTLQKRSFDFLRFSWIPIPCGSRNTVVRRYQGELYSSSNVLIHRARILDNKISSKIIGLQSCTTYWFRVGAVGSERFGDYSPLVQGTTLEGGKYILNIQFYQCIFDRGMGPVEEDYKGSVRCEQ